MKKLSIILVSFCLLFTSCDFLSVEDYFTDEMKLDSVFANKRNIEAYLWAIANYMPDEGQIYQNAQDAPGPFATDEGFTMFSTGSGYNGLRLILGEISASSMYNFSTTYAENYRVIHKCNTLLSRIDEASDLTALERNQIIANARFMRAYSYYKLLINYGPVVIVGDEVLPSNETLEYYNRPRNTYDESVEYICQELETAAANLPQVVSLMNFGRPTQGAAYGLIARVRLYHASPTFNGGSAAQRYFGTWKRSTDGKFYMNLQYDEKRWALAAAAAKRVIDFQNAGVNLYKLHTVDADGLTPALPANVTSDPNYYNLFPDGAGGIDPYKSYSEMFNGESVIPVNPEWVWARRSSAHIANTRMSFPTKRGGWSGAAVTQKMVDAYRMVDGRQIDNSSPEYPYSESGFTTEQKTFSGFRLNSGIFNMYANREARFYANVAFSESYWTMTSSTSSGSSNQTISYYFADPNGKASNPVDHTPTGYVIKKYIHPTDAWEGDNNARMDKAWPIVRLGDVMLMYVEALNNLTQSHSIEVAGETLTISRDMEEMSKYFNQIRYRAGLPGVTGAELANAETMQRLIQQERMTELLWENQRYYDVRRWGIYEESENEPIMGMNVDGDRSSFYARSIPNTSRIGNRVVNKKMIFLPIPLDEVRRVVDLDQNPGWEY
jgi:SusD family.